MLYADLIKTVFDHFYIGSNKDNTFLLQIFDIRYKLYVEFDDEYINRLRKRLPRTSIENVLARIVCRQQLYLLPRQLFFSTEEKQAFFNHPNLVSTATTFSPPPYLIIWLDEYFGMPENYRPIKTYLSMATQLVESIWDDTDIDNLIIANDFKLSIYESHLRMFTDVDCCRNYIDSQQNNSILLITSNRKGQEILPHIYDRILNIYILRNHWNDWQWGFDYIESLQMFDDDQCMLARVIRDLARHFVEGASRLEPADAIKYLHWAKKLYIQADHQPLFKSVRFTSAVLNYIHHQLDYLEALVRTLNKDYEDEGENNYRGILCT